MIKAKNGSAGFLFLERSYIFLEKVNKGELLKWDPESPLNVYLIDNKLPSDKKAPGNNAINALNPDLPKDEPTKTQDEFMRDFLKYDPQKDFLYIY